MPHLESFRGIHVNEKVVVCGCGTSLNLLIEPKKHVTIGINDVGRAFTPTYLFVQDREASFPPERFQYIRQSEATFCFTPIPILRLMKAPVVRFRASRYGGTDWSMPGRLPYSSTSAYMAICLAALLGGNPIGLIGVDFSDDHFFGRTGTHRLASREQKLNDEFLKLNDALREGGLRVFNLSPRSRIDAFARCSLADFDVFQTKPQAVRS